MKLTLEENTEQYRIVISRTDGPEGSISLESVSIWDQTGPQQVVEAVTALVSKLNCIPAV
jgi:hypothetical protein